MDRLFFYLEGHLQYFLLVISLLKQYRVSVNCVDAYGGVLHLQANRPTRN